MFGLTSVEDYITRVFFKYSSILFLYKNYSNYNPISNSLGKIINFPFSEILLSNLREPR